MASKRKIVVGSQSRECASADTMPARVTASRPTRGRRDLPPPLQFGVGIILGMSWGFTTLGISAASSTANPRPTREPALPPTPERSSSSPTCGFRAVRGLDRSTMFPGRGLWITSGCELCQVLAGTPDVVVRYAAGPNMWAGCRPQPARPWLPRLARTRPCTRLERRPRAASGLVYRRGPADSFSLPRFRSPRSRSQIVATSLSSLNTPRPP